MKARSTVKWMIWLQFFTMALFLVTEVNGKRSCRKLLRKVKLPPHTKVASKQRKNNHVTLVCDKGYYFSKGKNSKDLSCKILRNITNDRIPKCKGCGQPPGIKNGTVKFPATSVGSVAVYSCDVGFSLKGTRKQRKCRKNFRWSGGRSRITCRKNKCRDPGNIKIRNGNVTFSDRLFEEFSTISFQCNDGYELFGDEDIVCLQGQWSIKRRPICREKRCPRPDVPENGRRFGSRFFIGSSVEFFCNSGFTLFGSQKRTCQRDKTWSGTVAVCDDGRSHCRNPGTPIGAIKSGRKHNEGDIVYYSCKPGLKLFQGSQNRTCLKNKTWSGSPPRCVDQDYKEFRPINETAELFSEGFVNSLLQKTCTGTNVSCPKPDPRARTLATKNYKEGLDLIFVLDASSSIEENNFKIAKTFVKKIIKLFGVDPRKKGDGTHVACVTYGTAAKTQFTFNDASAQTKGKALKRIDAIDYERGATGTRLALDLVRTKVLPSSRRPNSTKALFLITDGEANVGGAPWKAAKYLKEEKNVKIYVIGVGGKIRHESLEKLASSPPKRHKFEIESYAKLDKIMKKIAVKGKTVRNVRFYGNFSPKNGIFTARREHSYGEQNQIKQPRHRIIGTEP